MPLPLEKKTFASLSVSVSGATLASCFHRALPDAASTAMTLRAGSLGVHAQALLARPISLYDVPLARYVTGFLWGLTTR